MSIYIDRGLSMYHFHEHMLVRCPSCGRCAHVRRRDDGSVAHRSWFDTCFDPRRLSCSHCGYVKDRRGGGSTVYYGGNVTGWGTGGFTIHHSAFDWYFDLPLWLQTPCCGKVLWALNREHLNFLEEFVGAKQRVKAQSRDIEMLGEMRNGTLANRLPLWMKQAKNREDVLRGIQRLRKLYLEI